MPECPNCLTMGGHWVHCPKDEQRRLESQRLTRLVYLEGLLEINEAEIAELRGEILDLQEELADAYRAMDAAGVE